MSFEAINNLDKRNRGTEIKETADKLLSTHEQVAKYLEKLSIQPESFSDLYGDEVIARDERYVTNIKKDFAEDATQPGPEGMTHGEVKKLAEILEYHTYRGINAGNWLPYCRAIKTAEYDDIKNGVDMVVEFTGGGAANHLGLGVDISFSHHLEKKFERIKKDIDSFDGEKNQLGVVKYFHSKSLGIKGQLSNLPRVVAAFDLGVLDDIARTKNDKLAGHIAQHKLITEMEHQLNVYHQYALRANPQCARPIEQALHIIHTISDALHSEERLEDSEYNKNRKVDAAIERGLEIFK